MVVSLDIRCYRVEYDRKAIEELDLNNVDVVCVDAKSYSFNDVDSIAIAFHRRC